MSRRRLLLCLTLLCVPLLLVGPIGRYIVVLPLVLFAPGYLIERALRFPVPIPWMVRPALWFAGSLTIVPVLYAWAWLVGLQLTFPVLVIALAGCTFAVGWQIWHNEYQIDSTNSPPWDAGLAGALIVACTFGRRFYEIRDDALPLWVDSVHHAVLIRVVAESGTIPLDVRPYLPVSELPYHWGFHAVVGTIMRVSGLDLPHTLLWSGQIVNALQVLTVGALAAYLWRSNVAGLVAGLVVGLVSLMPAYLVTWGRYTLLDGLLIVPPLVIAALAGMRGAGWRPWTFVALLTGGLLLVHYIASVFALALVSLLFVWHIAADQHRRPNVSIVHHAVKTAWGLGLALIAGALLATPWLLILSRRIFARYAQEPNALRGGGSYNAFSDGLFLAGHNRLLFTVAALALLISLWRRRSAGIYLAAWPLLLLFMSNPNIVGLPVLWLVTNTEVLVSLYIPVAALIGGGVALLWQMAAAPEQHSPPEGKQHRSFGYITARQGLLVTAIVIGAFAGERTLGDVINPTTRIATAADVEAINWIAANTPPDARFLTAATSWLPDADRGADGGWWVVPLARRWSSTPPVLFTYADPGEVAAIQTRTRALASLPEGEEAATLERIAEQEDIDYVYVGSTEHSFKAAWFDNNPTFERVYDRNGIVIFAHHP